MRGPRERVRVGSCQDRQLDRDGVRRDRAGGGDEIRIVVDLPAVLQVSEFLAQKMRQAVHETCHVLVDEQEAGDRSDVFGHL